MVSASSPAALKKVDFPQSGFTAGAGVITIAHLRNQGFPHVPA
jgi:hypothetical protein